MKPNTRKRYKRRPSYWRDESEADREVNRRAVMRRARAERWNFPGRARVVHPAHGEIIVPCASNLAAVMCAAEVWGCKWADITDAKVWACDT